MIPPTSITVRRSTLDRVVSVVLIICCLLVTAASLALYVQRHNQPTVIYYCDRAHCVPKELGTP